MHITDSQLVFEGIRRPLSVLAFRESGIRYSNSGGSAGSAGSADEIVVLERYLSDIQNLFLKNLSAFSIGDGMGRESTAEADDSRATKLRSLLEEIIKVKALILNQTDFDQKSRSKKQASRPQKPGLRRRNS
jgi:hypothetical protein